MPSRGEIQTPYSGAVVPTPGGDASGGGGTSGGFDLPGGATPKETPNSMSGLPAQQTTVSLQGDDPGPSGQIPMPPVASPGTIKTEGV